MDRSDAPRVRDTAVVPSSLYAPRALHRTTDTDARRLGSIDKL